MAQIYISVGSNQNAEENVQAGVRELRDRFDAVTCSAVYESRAVGFDGDNFLNLVVGATTGLSPLEVAAVLRQIEDAHGRDRNQPKFSSRTLDLDLLLYDDQVLNEGKLQLPREEITYNAFVLGPLCELAGELRHPVVGETYQEMWSRFDKASQPLWPVDLSV